MSQQAAECRSRDRPFPKVWHRKDGALGYHCSTCGKPLIIAKIEMQPGDYIQAVCKWCGKERRFTAEDVRNA